MRRLALVAAVGAVCASAAAPVVRAVHAQSLRSGFTQTALPRGDDNFAGALSFGFTANLFGGDYTGGFVCTNGYVIFGLSPAGSTCVFPGQNAAAASVGGLGGLYGTVLAPYFLDVNTSPAASGQVFVGTGLVDGRNAWAATWDGVFAYLPGGLTTGTLRNTFQLVLVDRSDRMAGDVDWEFNYGALGSTGVPAFVGLADDGGFSGTPFAFQLGGSGPTASFGDGGANALAGRRVFGNFSAGQATVVPEPATIALTAAGLAVTALLARRRRAA